MDKMDSYQRLETPPPMSETSSTGPSFSLHMTENIPGSVAFSVPTDSSKSSRFHHVPDLDKFFTRIYRYHQRNGFFCMLLQESLELVQLAYVVIFSTFLFECIDYDILFANKIPDSWKKWIGINETAYNATLPYGVKLTLSDAVIPSAECVKKFSGGMIVLIVLAAIFWFYRLAKVITHYFSYSETNRFYRIALKIDDHELSNLTWHEVLQRLLQAQKIHNMCIHKSELTELDVYHRILRVENYLVAMVNKDALPFKIRLPFIGEMTTFSKSYLYNLEFILFRGLGSPFEHNWQLREDYKIFGKRQELANQLQKRITYFALVNLIFCPVILVWRIMYAFFDYADMIKRDPGTLGSRRWSSYGRFYLRHFNEVEHELDARLNRAYRVANQYMNIFTNPAVTILAKNMAFVAGSLLAVLILCTVLDEDVLKVSHMITAITLLGVIVAIARACIPDEHVVFCPEHLLSIILSEIHYSPETWKGRAHTSDVRKEFSQLFHFRFTHILEELLSPVITPVILYFSLRKESLAIVDFFRNYTVDLIGVGDVCSFAEMDIRKHGDPEWTPDSLVDLDRIIDGDQGKAANGKTELSLIHFKLTNPEWRPPVEAVWFMQKVREQVEKNAQQMQLQTVNFEENPVVASLAPLGARVQGMMAPSMPGQLDPARGNVHSQEGHMSGSGSAGLLSSVKMDHSVGSIPVNQQVSPLELTAMDMSFSALFMHELHRKRMKQSLMHYGTIGEDLKQEVPSPVQPLISSASDRRSASSSSRENKEGDEEGTPLLLLKKY